jgi:phenylacetate-CoA ligase
MADRTDQMVLKFRDVLAATEQLSSNELIDYQRQLLAPLISHARTHLPFYKTRLDPLFKGNKIDWSSWTELPILTRAEAQAEIRDLSAPTVPPHLGPIHMGSTSGSTGTPLSFSINELQTVASRALTDRLYRWWNFDGERTLATFVSRVNLSAPAPNGATYRSWRTGFSSGKHHLLDVTADIDQQIDWLLKRQPNYLCAYSSALSPLARRARERGIDLHLEGIIGKSSVVSSETRALCREVFGAPLTDQYGANEVGMIAVECPHCSHYHIAAEAVLVEIVNERNQPCPPGATGRVIVTPFYSYATTFIRYDTGDYATVGSLDAHCPIGLPVLDRIVGRYRNTFRLADGRIIYPSLSGAKLSEYISMVQFQIVQTRFDEIEVRYIPAKHEGPVDEESLGHYIRQELDPSFRVKTRQVARLPRSANGKFEDFLSLVERET